MTLALLIVLLWIPVYKFDLHEQDTRRPRMQDAASALASAARTPEEAIGALTIGEFETHYAVYIGEGRCKEGYSKKVSLMPKAERKAFTSPDRCDPDRKGIPRARSYWQLWQATCPKAWEAEQGSLEELQAAARCAVERFRHGLSFCKSIEGAFAFYRHSSCAWKGAPARAARYQELLRQYYWAAGRSH